MKAVLVNGNVSADPLESEAHYLATALTTTTTALPVVDSTDKTNDLRIRVFGRDSASGGMTTDEARFTGANPYLAAFSLYPVKYTDVADTTPNVIPWELAGP